MISKAILAAVTLTAASFVFAQVEVIDRSPAANTQVPTPQPVANTGAQTGELYYQLQLLQQEVLELRGIVEQQAHELKRLKQQRLDDYLDVDRRLSAMGSAGSRPSASANKPVSAEPSGNAAPAPAEEIKHYRSAIDLVLREKKYDQAIVQLKEHLKQYPQGRYSANAMYWLGEIYLLKNSLDESRQWFSKLIADYPAHRKVPDGKFKLAKVYHLQGNDEQAKALLNEVAASGSAASQLAKNYLRDNFGS